IASRNTCVTSRGSMATCSARSHTPRSRRSRPGTAPTSRRRKRYDAPDLDCCNDRRAATMTPTRSMVLAAGLGTRMRPFNGHIPKPLVPVGGKCLIDHVLDRLAAASVERAVVNVHHRADEIERPLAPRRQPQIVISDERAALLGTGGGIVKALPELGA